jgi:hypothetical protein
MLAFLSFLVLLGIAYLVWRVTDQLPDLVFRLSEIQRDVAELRRRGGDGAAEPAAVPASTAQTAIPEPPAAATPAATASADTDPDTSPATSGEGAQNV